MGMHTTVGGAGNGTHQIPALPSADWYQITLEGEGAAITGGSLAVVGRVPGGTLFDVPIEGSPVDLSTARGAVIPKAALSGFELTLSGLAGPTTAKIVVTSGSNA